MENLPDNFESDEFIDKLLIESVKKCPSLYNTDIYSAADEREWDEIQKLFGIQKSWLKKRWRTIRNDYRRITIYNLSHSNKAPIHKMANQLNFLTIDLNGANNMNFDDLKRPQVDAFHITKEMLDNCDINESITFDSISMPTVCGGSTPVTKSNVASQATEPTTSNEPEYSEGNTAKSSDALNKNVKEEPNDARATNTNAAEQRCEDEIFGEFVVAMLKKLPVEERKRAKKEIMNILL